MKTTASATKRARKSRWKITPPMKRVINQLSRYGTQTTLQLALDLKRAPSDIYYLLSSLRRAGLIECIGTLNLPVRGRPVNIWKIRPSNSIAA